MKSTARVAGPRPGRPQRSPAEQIVLGLRRMVKALEVYSREVQERPSG